jgi:Concanavalin A-like lectin/glucanases superfamily
MKRVSFVVLISLTLGAVTAAPAYAALAAEWHMDSLPTMVDSSGNGNDGTASSDVTLAAGVSGEGYNFNPQNGAAKVEVPDSDSLDPGTQSISFSAWVNFTAVPDSDYNVIRKGLGTAAGGYYKMEIKRKVVNNVAIARARCQFKDSTKKTTALMKGPNLADGTWHKLTCVKESGRIRLVVDGKAFNKSVTLGSISNGSKLTLALNEDGDDQYPGLMDEALVSIGG